MRLRSLIYTAVLTLLLPSNLLAWGWKGHKIVAQVAMNRLSPATKDKVLQVLGSMTPASAATISLKA